MTVVIRGCPSAANLSTLRPPCALPSGVHVGVDGPEGIECASCDVRVRVEWRMAALRLIRETMALSVENPARPDAARERLIVALDLPDLGAARALVDELGAEIRSIKSARICLRRA